MKFLKNTLAVFLVIAMIIPLSVCFAFADNSENWMFIQGENIIRQSNTAVIYYGSESIILNSRGHDVVLDADGVVTEIYQGSIGDDRIIDIEEGGAVVSASGSASQWLKDNLKKGSKVFYDRLTHKLFLCDAGGNFDPYFTKEFPVEAIGTDYRIKPQNEDDASAKYTYSVTVDENGIIVSTDIDAENVEGGFKVSVVTEEDRQSLVMFSILGGKCTISDGKAIFSYSKDLLSSTAQLAFEDAKSKIEKAKENFDYINVSDADDLLQAAEQIVSATKWDYLSLSAFVASLATDVEKVCSQKISSELRSAFHTPDETSEAQVRTTVKAAKAAGLNSIILRTPNTIGTFINLPESFPFRADEKFGNFDLLNAYIRICAEEDMGLTLCLDVYYNQYASVANKDWVAKNDDVSVGNKDNSEAAAAVASSGDIQSEYFSPASAEYKEYFISYVEYIVKNYSINSIMFDYLRYPKFSENDDIGYDNETMSAFSQHIKKPINEVYKIKEQKFSSPYWSEWVEFRMGLINDMAEAISAKVKSINSDIVLTAVAARDSVNYYYMQEPDLWLENGWMDGICIALYESDASENDQLPPLGYYGNMVSEKTELFSSHTADTAFLFVGIEASGAYSADTISKAISQSRSKGADGFVFSSLNDYLAQNYYNYLSEGAMNSQAISPLGEADSVIMELLEFTKDKLNGFLLPLGEGNEAIVGNAVALIDDALNALSNGNFDYSYATQLKSDISVCLASAAWKQSAMAEIEKICKVASIAEKDLSDESVDTETDESTGVTDESKENSSVIMDSQQNSKEDNSQNGSDENIKNDGKNRSVSAGEILVYLFITFALVAAVAFMVINAKRSKKPKPINRHMNKGNKN